jgi:hypothetical protein
MRWEDSVSLLHSISDRTNHSGNRQDPLIAARAPRVHSLDIPGQWIDPVNERLSPNYSRRLSHSDAVNRCKLYIIGSYLARST